MFSRNSLFSYALPVALVFAGSAFLLQGEKKPAGQDHGKPAAPAGGGMEFPMEKPSPEHLQLKKCVGVWDTTIHFAMAPGTPMQESKGTSTYTGVGDFWIVEEVKSDMMGMPFTGHGVTGYNAKTKKFMNTWCDSMASEMMISEGTADEATKTVTMTGECTDMTGKRVKCRMTIEHKDDNNRVFSMFMPGPDGKEYKCMYIDYKRRK